MCATRSNTSVDREKIVQNVFFGHGTAGNGNPIPMSVKFGIDPEPKHSYNPDKVKERSRRRARKIPNSNSWLQMRRSRVRWIQP